MAFLSSLQRRKRLPTKVTSRFQIPPKKEALTLSKLTFLLGDKAIRKSWVMSSTPKFSGDKELPTVLLQLLLDGELGEQKGPQEIRRRRRRRHQRPLVTEGLRKSQRLSTMTTSHANWTYGKAATLFRTDIRAFLLFNLEKNTVNASPVRTFQNKMWNDV